jgi:8-oxo-dGTP pyrophosphatase MutT (NUDIX family)
VSVKQPVVPAPAATLVLLRDRPAGGFEILLMQRHHESRFAAGDFVFPGGKLEADDNPEDAVRWCAGLDLAGAARTLALEDAPSTALGYWVGAIRETFEEAGVLLATAADGGPVRLPAARVADYRRAIQADNRAFWTMVKDEKLVLSTDRLVYFAHWITPVGLPLRFDTRFFAAPMPAGQEAVGDDHEMISLRWLSPREALDAHARGRARAAARSSGHHHPAQGRLRRERRPPRLQSRRSGLRRPALTRGPLTPSAAAGQSARAGG